MASLPKNFSVILPLLILSFLIASAQAGSIAVYWGQGLDSQECTLEATCATRNYAYVMLSFLIIFGNFRTPVLDLGKHCNPSSGGCRRLSSDINSARTWGLSYTLSSTSDAQNLAEHLWGSYLGGTFLNRPLGSTVLDGIDFDIEHGGPNFYDDLANFLSEFSSRGKKVYLTAAPQCPFPDSHLSKALATRLFDFVWVQFFDNPQCEYRTGDISRLMISWTTWVNSIKATQFFLGLLASQIVARSGYIPPDELKSLVPVVKTLSSRYGGIMLWSRYYDVLNDYSGQVKSDV